MAADAHAAEKILRSGAANHFKGMEAVGGKLFLTPSRLVFKSHRLNIQVHQESYPISDVVSVEPRRGLSLVGDGMAVVFSDGREERFVVFGRHDWIAGILAAREQATAGTA